MPPKEKDHNPQPNLLELFRGMLDDHLGKKEFLTAFEDVINHVKEADTKTAEAVTAIAESLTAKAEEIRQGNSSNFETHKAEALTLVAEALTKIDAALSAVDAKIASVRDGQDADEAVIVDSVLEKIKLPEQKEIILDTPQDIRNKLEVLQDGEKLAIEAIEGLRKELDALKKNNAPFLMGGGPHYLAGSGITISGNVLSATGGALSVLTATGTVDDSNTTFTFASTPTLVIVNGATYRHGKGVTIATTTATLDNPVGIGGDIYALG